MKSQFQQPLVAQLYRIRTRKKVEGKHVMEFCCTVCQKTRSKRKFIIEHIIKHHAYKIQQLRQQNDSELHQAVIDRQQELVQRLDDEPAHDQFHDQPQSSRQIWKAIGDIGSKLDNISSKVDGMDFERIQKNKLPQVASEQVVNYVGQTILNNLILKLTVIFGQVQELGIDLPAYIPTVRVALVQKLQAVDLASVFSLYQKSLEQHDKRLQERQNKEKISRKTFLRYRYACTFWQKYSSVTSFNLSIIVNDILTLSNNRNKAVVQYYGTMAQATDCFPSLPRLPKSVKNRKPYIKRQFSKISLEDVQLAVRSLFNEGKKEQACDLWAVTTTGFRKSQLLRMRFQDERGDFCQSLEMFQFKNKNMTVRMVPQSLKRLISLCGNSFPMTLERYSRLRSYCIQNFHRFYSLRGTCFTSIIAGLSETYILSKFHHSSRVTFNNYLDKNNIRLINSIFSLKWDELSDLQVTTADKRLKFPENGEVLEELVNANPILLPELKIEFDEMEQQDAAILTDNDFQKDQESRKTGKTQDQLFNGRILRIRQTIFRETSVETNPMVFDRPMQAIYSLLSMEDQDIKQVWNDLNESDAIGIAQSNPFVKIDKIIYTEQSSKMRVEGSTRMQQDGLKMEVFRLIRVELEEDIVYLVGIQEFAIKHNRIERQRLPRKSKSTRDVGQQTWKFKWTMKCKSCSAPCDVIDEQCRTQQGIFHHIYGCQLCSRVNEHLCRPSAEILDHPFQGIVPTKKTSLAPAGWKQLPRTESENNISAAIQKTGRKLISSNVFSRNIPSSIETHCFFLDDKHSQMVVSCMKEEQHLPIEIRKCFEFRIFGAGVFATENIQQGSLVLVYLGKICILSEISVQQKNDSLFSLGPLFSARSMTELVIDPQQFCNATRFVNSSRTFKNCRSEKVVFNRNADKRGGAIYEMAVVLIASKNIVKGDQLFYDYEQSDNYWGSSKMREPCPQDVSTNNIKKVKITEHKQKITQTKKLHQVSNYESTFTRSQLAQKSVQNKKKVEPCLMENIDKPNFEQEGEGDSWKNLTSKFQRKPVKPPVRINTDQESNKGNQSKGLKIKISSNKPGLLNMKGQEQPELSLLQQVNIRLKKGNWQQAKQESDYKQDRECISSKVSKKKGISKKKNKKKDQLKQLSQYGFL